MQMCATKKTAYFVRSTTLNTTKTVECVKYFIHIVYKLYPFGKHVNQKIDYLTVFHIF